MYIQLDFILRRWVEMANETPALRDQQPWKAAVEKDYAWLGNAVTKHYRGDDSDMPAVMKGVLTAFAGVTFFVASRARKNHLNSPGNTAGRSSA